MHETLVTKEMMKVLDPGDYYKIQSDSRGLNYEKYFSDGDVNNIIPKEYNSSNTRVLDKEELKNFF